ncbi:MAG: DUF952 domain-containing protein [Ilumatobacteraceae bacterium]
MIFHITDAGRWAQSCVDGAHTSSTLGVELHEQGFIHCSTTAQVAGVLGRFYRGVPNLVLLHIDESRLTAPLRFEPANGPVTGSDEDPTGDPTSRPAGQFPHVYGPIDLAAVVAVEPIEAPPLKPATD